MQTYSMDDFDQKDKTRVPHISSYDSLPSNDLESSGNDTYQHRHRPTWQITTRTYHNYRVHKQHHWNTIRADLKSVPWRWVIRRFCSHILPIITIVGLLTLLRSLPTIIDDAYGIICKPDGTFDLSQRTFTPWKRDAIFSITMGYGNYSFGVAKLIDVVWDVTVGRGGQVLLAAFTYKAFTKSLTRNMESSLVSVETFKAMTLQNDTFYGVLKMMRYFQQNGGKRAKVAMFWTILSALFVLLMPTWLSAMTGYVAAIEGFVQDSSDNLVPFEEFRPVIYTIHDGDRLGEGYTKDYRVAIPWVNYEDNYYVLSDYYGCWSALSRTYNDSAEPVKWKDDADASCTLLWRLSEYTSQYGFLGLNNTETDFTFPNMTNVTIPEPSLNISANFALYGGNPSYYDTFEWWYLPYGVNWRRNDTNEMPFATSDPFFYHQSSGTGYNLTELNQNGSCQQLDNVRYKWGFSFILLYAFIATWLIWNIVVFGIYLDSYLHSRLDVAKRSIGLERAVFDLSLAMQKKTDAESVVMTGNDRLQHLIRGGHMTYKDLPLNSLPPTRWNQIRKWWEGFRFWPWAKAEKWWLAAMLIFDLFFILSVTTGRFKRGWCPHFSALPGFGVFLVLLVGRNAQGRWLIFVFWFLLFWIGNIWWILWGHNY